MANAEHQGKSPAEEVAPPTAETQQPAEPAHEASLPASHLLGTPPSMLKPAHIQTLQRSIGNRSLGRMLEGQESGPVQRHVPPYARDTKEVADDLIATSRQRMSSAHVLVTANRPEEAQESLDQANDVAALARAHYDMGFDAAQSYPTTEAAGVAGTSGASVGGGGVEDTGTTSTTAAAGTGAGTAAEAQAPASGRSVSGPITSPGPVPSSTEEVAE